MKKQQQANENFDLSQFSNSIVNGSLSSARWQQTRWNSIVYVALSIEQCSEHAATSCLKVTHGKFYLWKIQVILGLYKTKFYQGLCKLAFANVVNITRN